MSNLGDPRKILDFDVLYGWRLHEGRSSALRGWPQTPASPSCGTTNDDLRTIDAPSPEQRRAYGGYNGHQVFRRMVGVMRTCALVTTPSAELGKRYEAASGAEVRVVENHVESIVEPPRRRWWSSDPERIVVGWVANREHRADVDLLGLSAPFQRLLDAHPTVEVMSVGCDLRLDGRRYHHIPSVEFDELRSAIAQFDVGVAPIADTPFNRARSSIKVKEYAALGIPWLASP